MENKEQTQSPEADWDARAAEVNRKRVALFNLDIIKFGDLFGKFGERLQEKYKGEQKHYLLYHILGGSTLRGETKYYDFPGEDSVEAFINKFYEENIEKK